MAKTTRGRVPFDIGGRFDLYLYFTSETMAELEQANGQPFEVAYSSGMAGMRQLANGIYFGLLDAWGRTTPRLTIKRVYGFFDKQPSDDATVENPDHDEDDSAPERVAWTRKAFRNYAGLKLGEALAEWYGIDEEKEEDDDESPPPDAE